MQYIGDQDFLDNIEKFLLSEKKHHSLLFSGSKGIGKSLAAKQVVGKIIKEQQGNEIYNLKWISPADNKSQKITIDQIREISDFLNQTNFDGNYKFVVIDSADDLNINSANSLLKPLEEPSANTIFILINHKNKALLPTIRSRCVEFKFKTPTKDQLKKIIKRTSEKDDEEIEKSLIIANDSLGVAIDITQSNLTDFYIFLLEEFKSRKFNYIKFKSFIDKAEFNDLWHVYFYLLKRFLYILLNRQTILCKEEKVFLQEIPHLDVDAIAKLFDEINNIEYKVATLYLNKKDSYQAICLKVHRICQKIFI